MKAFLIAAVTFGIVDTIWLKFVANSLYREKLGSMLAKKPNWIAGILFYVIFLIGIVVFVISPAEDIADVIWKGALYGLITYATYDLTNQATLKKWPVAITIIDLCWGVFASIVIAVVSWSLS